MLRLDPEALPKDGICRGVWERLPAHVGVLHGYCDRALGLGPLMAGRMKAMTPAAYEGVLHPIFQENELTLVLVGGFLGWAAGVFQLQLSAWADGRRARKEAAARPAPERPE